MSLGDFISTNSVDASGRLTREALLEAAEQIRTMPPHPCSLGRHVVSSGAVRDGRTWALCANCGKPVRLKN